MVVKYQKLKDALQEHFGSITECARQMGESVTYLSRKLTGEIPFSYYEKEFIGHHLKLEDGGKAMGLRLPPSPYYERDLKMLEGCKCRECGKLTLTPRWQEDVCQECGGSLQDVDDIHICEACDALTQNKELCDDCQKFVDECMDEFVKKAFKKWFISADDALLTLRDAIEERVK